MQREDEYFFASIEGVGPQTLWDRVNNTPSVKMANDKGGPIVSPETVAQFNAPVRQRIAAEPANVRTDLGFLQHRDLGTSFVLWERERAAT